MQISQAEIAGRDVEGQILVEAPTQGMHSRSKARGRGRWHWVHAKPLSSQRPRPLKLSACKAAAAKHAQHPCRHSTHTCAAAVHVQQIASRSRCCAVLESVHALASEPCTHPQPSMCSTRGCHAHRTRALACQLLPIRSFLARSAACTGSSSPACPAPLSRIEATDAADDGTAATGLPSCG
eukprot:366381-Chlamydomonas_euryale.AAC.2